MSVDNFAIQLKEGTKKSHSAAENTTFVKEILADKAKLIKVTNLLGKIVDPTSVSDNTTLFYIYDDGRVEKRLIFD